ncbi:MAG: ATP synthase F1 subunit delta [Ardenticatenaceae bacterium]
MSKNVSNYAQALVQSALGKWLDQLAEVQNKLHRDPEIESILSDANSLPTMRKSAVRQLMPVSASPEISQFVRLLVREGDVNLLGEIIRHVRTLVPAIGNESNVVVISAQELSKDEIQKLERQLRGKHGDNLQVAYEVDPQLLGGMRIRVGDQVMDHTVAARLNALREQLVG